MDLLTKFYLFIFAIVILLISAFLAYKNKKFTKILGIVGIFYGVIYFIWRLFFTLPHGFSVGLVFGILLLIVEFTALVNTVLIKILFSTDKNLKLEKDNVFKELPEIDIFVATYNESVDILKRTLFAAKDINYPKEKVNIYVGDDGSREEVKVLCQENGINYVTRDDHKGAKAGNINNLLKNSSSDLILTLDADMIPSKEIINKMVYFFEDSKTGFVQSPQVFYNHDIFQYNLNVGEFIPNEQDFFMRTILEKRAAYNAVLHVGCNAIFSRKAIEDIGGIPTSSITEDMATGMLIQAKEYKSFFVNEPLAIGLTVENVRDLIKQRDRWLRGSIQVFKTINPIFTKGLSFIQKLIYTDGMLYWSYGFNKMIYIICPLLYLLFREVIFEANGYDVAMMFIPYFLSNALYFRRISDNGRNITWSHIYETATAPFMAVAYVSEFIFGSRLKFNVTPKGEVNDKDHFNLRLAFPHLILLILSIIAFIINIYYISNNSIISYPSLVINFFWCAYNMLGIIVTLFVFIDRKRYRKTERIPVSLKAKSLISSCNFKDECESCGLVNDISDLGANINIKKGCEHFTFKKNEIIEIKIENIGVMNCEIVRLNDDKEDKYHRMGVKFINPAFEEFVNINRYRFDIANKYLNDTKIKRSAEGFTSIFNRIIFKRKK